MQQFRALYLLALLVLGNAPRQWLHDYFATHTGCAVITKQLLGKDCIQTDRPHCKPVDLVIASPYVAPTVNYLAAPLSVFPKPVAKYFTSTPSRYICRSGLRGPPALFENKC